MGNIIIRLIDTLPCSVRGFTKQDGDGNYNVYINSRIAENRQHEALRHELRHITEEDFSREELAHIIETINIERLEKEQVI